MDKEVLLNFKQARSHKKVAYVVSACANGKNNIILFFIYYNIKKDNMK